MAEDEVVIPQLPEHNGQVPSGVVTTFTGTSSRLTRPLSAEDEVLVLVPCRVTEEGHRVVTDGLHRLQKLKATDMFLLEGPLAADAQKLLNKARKNASALDDASKARAPLPGINDGEDDDDGEDDPLSKVVG
ncbi:MAG: hypothetical protein JWN67_5064 [Actinomycetia bacterium]|nr:hypothetical protein [Actinomycetes bacterium]